MLLTTFVYTFVAAFVALAVFGHILLAVALWPSLNIFRSRQDESSPAAAAMISTTADDDDLASVDGEEDVASAPIYKPA